MFLSFSQAELAGADVQDELTRLRKLQSAFRLSLADMEAELDEVNKVIVLFCGCVFILCCFVAASCLNSSSSSDSIKER